MDFIYPPGATPLDKNESEGLLLGLIRTQRELDTAETMAIQNALTWAQKSRKLRNELLTISGLTLLHKRMFGGIWSWAGTFRQTEKNIGCLSQHIQTEVSQLCDNLSYRIAEKFFSSWQELAVEFHHELVKIHAFPNGNGRHARLAADSLLHFNKQFPLTWGERRFQSDEDRRREYIQALREADKGMRERLYKFAI